MGGPWPGGSSFNEMGRCLMNGAIPRVVDLTHV
jgi:hypothetical protein